MGYVLRGHDENPRPDGEVDHEIARICRRAGLPVRYWHTLRHTFGTHAALCGVNPWRLQGWLGHKRIDETMLYVHVAEAHARALPPPVLEASLGITDSDARVIAQLGARVAVAHDPIGPEVARCQRSPEAAAPSAVSEQDRETARLSLFVVGSGGGFE